MDLFAVVIVASMFLLYSLISRRLEKTSITAPMLFTAFGIAIGLLSYDLLGTKNMNQGVVHILAEITLVFVLFTDAARIHFRALRNDYALPQRLLFIGLPLCVIFGALGAYLLIDGFSIWDAALVAAILAPTDAALGQAVVTSKVVPERIRQTLSVESGLNDGIVLPAVLLFASFASSTMMVEHTGSYWVQFVLLQVLLGPVVGLAVGFTGAKLVNGVVKRDWVSRTFEGICALSIALIAFGVAGIVGGNGFIAAFVAGLGFGHFLTNRCEFLYEFAESEGQFFTLSTFLIFGTIAVAMVSSHFEWVHLIYAVLSLTVIRMIPVALSLIGARVSSGTVLFLGWFGPRGLASILFALLILEEMEIARAEEITSIVTLTVLMSVLLHGVTAVPLSSVYGRSFENRGECEETKPAAETAGR